MTITPDIIWELILIGFTQHLNSRSSMLRKKIVKFEGEKTIKIDRTEKYDLKDLTKDDW